MEEPSYYAVIPADVRYDKTLPPNAKLLYGEITALCNKHGYCWSGNKYFADLYNVTNETISRWISQLKESGYIRTELIYKDQSKEINSRRIYLLTIKSIPIDKKINTPPQKNQYPIDEKIKDNNTVNNTSYYEEEREPQAEIAGNKIAIAVNQEATAEKEIFLTAIREIYGAEVLADEWRWSGTIAKAIQNKLTVKEYAAALRQLLAQNRKYPITPENVLTVALQDRAKLKPFIPEQPTKPKYESRNAEMLAKGFPPMGVRPNA